MNHTEAYQIAKKRVAKKKGFFVHFGFYLILMGVLMLINLFTYQGDVWFIFPALGWGISIAIHYLAVFGVPGIDEAWEEKALEKELSKLQKDTLPALPSSPKQKITEDYEELDLQQKIKKVEKRWDDLV